MTPKEKETETPLRWIDIFKKYEPDITEKKAEYLLWNETCYPFDNTITIAQIEQYYSNNKVATVNQ